jgi:hypothetical protein
MACLTITPEMLASGPVVIRVKAGERIVTLAGQEIFREPVAMAPRPPDNVQAAVRELARSGVVHRPEPPAPSLPPCAFLGAKVDDVKVVCSQPRTPLHECNHPKRPARVTRGGQNRPAMALPLTSCREVNGKTWQACGTCPLHPATSGEPN